MLGVFGSPQWRTVTGGSREYVAPGRRPARRRPRRHQGHLGARDRRRRRGHRRQRRRRRRTTPSSSPPTPTRRWRCSPSRRPASARSSPRMPYSANTALLHTDDLAAAAGATRARASWNFLRPRPTHRGAGHRDLRPDPADAAADPGRATWSPSAARTGSTRRRHRHDGVRPPALHPGLRGRPAPAARDRHRPDRLRRRLPRLGLPRGRRAFGARGRRAPGARRGTPMARRTASPRTPRGRPIATTITHTRRRRSSVRFTHRATPGSSTSTPARPRRARPVRGPRPPR